MFSATFPKEIQRLASEFMTNYVFVAVTPRYCSVVTVTATATVTVTVRSRCTPTMCVPPRPPGCAQSGRGGTATT